MNENQALMMLMAGAGVIEINDQIDLFHLGDS